MNFATAQQQAQGKWHSLLPNLGIDSRYLTGKHGPCPICAGKDRFRFDDKDGKGGWICSGCGAGDGFSLVAKVKKFTLAQAKEAIEPLLPNAKSVRIATPRDDDDCRKNSTRFWRNTIVISGVSPVDKYLFNRLNAPNPSVSLRAGHSTHPANKGQSYTVMAAKISDAAGELVSVHRTFLTEDGQKADVTPNKMIMAGSIPPGSAIRLFGVSQHLAIAEGIETALAAYLDTGIPTWAAINAPLMKSFDPPQSVKKLTIFSDNDEHYVGQAAAYELARRMVMTRGIKVEVRLPPKAGTDWLDYWKGRQ
jgi:putative DNA primase/helicase